MCVITVRLTHISAQLKQVRNSDVCDCNVTDTHLDPVETGENFNVCNYNVIDTHLSTVETGGKL